MDNITFKQLDNGEIVQVVTSTTVEEIPFSKEEIKRQISQHSEIVNNLQLQLQALEEFEDTDKEVQEIIIAETVDTPIINQDTLDTIVSSSVV